ncbi:MAG: DUF2799 domain-containing protein [Terriglobales bacterium]
MSARNAMKKFLLLACLLALAGCLSMGAEGCRNADWNRLGQRDGYSGGGAMLEVYAADCAAHGVRPDAAAYAKGMETGAANRLLWWGPPSSRP